jgi:hypothetical protein
MEIIFRLSEVKERFEVRFSERVQVRLGGEWRYGVMAE